MFVKSSSKDNLFKYNTCVDKMYKNNPKHVLRKSHSMGQLYQCSMKQSEVRKSKSQDSFENSGNLKKTISNVFRSNVPSMMYDVIKNGYNIHHNVKDLTSSDIQHIIIEHIADDIVVRTVTNVLHIHP